MTIPNTLYHYCSTEAFHSIISSRTIRLSSLTRSNDYMEGKLVSEAMLRLASRDQLSEADRDRLFQATRTLEDHVDGLGFCLSQEDDLLSQWRGYARDATGVSIGFSSDYLISLAESRKERDEPSFKLREVKYLETAHDSSVEPIYDELKQHIKNGAFEPSVGLLSALSLLDDEAKDQNLRRRKEARAGFNTSLWGVPSSMFFLKNEGFKEEKEWRLVSLYTPAYGHGILHRPVSNGLIPYREISMDLPDRNPITEVVLGPKHRSPIAVVEDFLERSKFPGVRARASKATYQ